VKYINSRTQWQNMFYLTVTSYLPPVGIEHLYQVLSVLIQHCSIHQVDNLKWKSMYYWISHHHNVPSATTTFKLLFPREDCNMISSQLKSLHKSTGIENKSEKCTKRGYQISFIFNFFLFWYTYIFFMLVYYL
jgi:hypothetical protein